MPLYEYSCENCGYVFEELVLGGKEASACPRCGGRVHRMMSTFSYEMPDEVCGKLPKGEQREVCKECRQGEVRARLRLEVCMMVSAKGVELSPAVY